MDIFLEYIVIRKKSAFDIFKAGSILLLTLFVLYFSLILYAVPMLSTFALLIDAGIIYLGWLGITSINIEYEYSVTNGAVDIDKIINKRKRKRVIAFKVSETEIIAPVNAPEHAGIFNSEFAKVIDASTRKNPETLYFAVVLTDAGRTKVLFNPPEKMIEAFRVYGPRKVF